MGLLRRKQPEFRPEDVYEQAKGLVVDLWQDAIQAKPELVQVGVENLLDTLNGSQSPHQMLGTVALSGNYLPADPNSRDAIRRATGKELVIDIPRAQSLGGDNTDSEHYALLNLRHTQGRLYNTLLEDIRESAGETNEFLGTRRRIAGFRYDYELEDSVFIGGISDNHPVNQLDIYCRPSAVNSNEYQYAHTIPQFPVMEDEEHYQKTGLIRRRDSEGNIIEEVECDARKERRFVPFTEESCLAGIKVIDLMAEHGVSSIEELRDKVKIDNRWLQAYYRLPKAALDDPFVSSFPYRAAALYNSLIGQANIFGKRLGRDPFDLSDDQQKHIARRIYEAALAQYARARIRRNTVNGKGLVGSVGLLDATDPNMHRITKMLTEKLQENNDFDPEDPTQAAMLQGTVIFEHAGHAPGGAMFSRPLGGEKAPIRGLMPIVNLPQPNYQGFNRYTHALNEIESGRIDGLPQMPGFLTTVMIPKVATDGGADFEVLTFIDVDEAPGYVAEWFNHSPEGNPWNFYYEPSVPQGEKVTLKNIMRGHYVRRQVGAAAVLGNVSHALVSMHGDVRDRQGAVRGFNIVRTLGPGDCFDISVPVAEPVANGRSSELVPVSDNSLPVRIGEAKALPMSQKDLSKPASRAEIKRMVKSGQVMPMRFTIPNTFDHDGRMRVVGGMIDSQANVHVNVKTEEEAEQETADYKELTGNDIRIPVPKTRTMSYGD